MVDAGYTAARVLAHPEVSETGITSTGCAR